ncbi:MAG: MGMT family protein [Chloroflexi bacterium]|nr:MGMT family protein [Chloroflexota bacterium]
MPTPSREIRTRKAWQVLVARATNRQTITYGELVALIGHPRSARTIGRGDLDPISQYCAENAMPDITAIVVQKSTGRPALVRTVKDVDAERELVYEYRWFAATPYHA